MGNKGHKLNHITILLIVSIAIAYIYQMAPSPLLGILRESFQLGKNDALLNLSVSIVFPMTIIASIVGGKVEQKIGTRRLFRWTLFFLSIGILINYIAANYHLFLMGRIVFGVGFGLGIPFIGSAIMKWYNPRQREVMNTINGLFPFLGTVISFSLMIPLYHLLGNSWKQSMGMWGIVVALLALIWVLFIKEKDVPQEFMEETGISGEKHLYLNLWKRQDIKMLCLIFGCDFFCYSYIAVILPTFLFEIGNMSEATAGIWAAIAFPAAGILGGLLGGLLTSSSGKRKPILTAGQAVKFIGIIIATLGASISVWVTIVGVSIFGIGNGMWMPVMYNIPMELKDMNSTRTGAAFALISSCGFASGFVSPIVGGWLTSALMLFSSQGDSLKSHVFGLKWSLFAFSFVNVISFILALKVNETGPAVRWNKSIFH